MLKLVGKESYERKYKLENVDEDKQPLFYIKKFSVSENSAIYDKAYGYDDAGKIQFLGGTVNRLKLKYGLVEWKNVKDSSGNDVKCTEETKDLLPTDVALWIVEEIDKLNGVSTKLSEDERKNFLSQLKS